MPKTSLVFSLLVMIVFLPFTGCNMPANPVLDEALKAACYIQHDENEPLVFDAGFYLGGVAVLAQNGQAFWVKEEQVYVVNDLARQGAPDLPQAPAGVDYDAEFILAAKTEDATEDAEPCANDPEGVCTAYDDAKALARKGDYAAALEKHILYHENILRFRPSQRGVRLSFALSYWGELGKKYPPALEALRAIRDRDLATLKKTYTDLNLVHDIAAINRYLDENSASVALFKEIAAINPRLAKRTYRVMRDALFEAREYQLSKQYMGDPMKQLQDAQESYAEDLITFSTSVHEIDKQCTNDFFIEDVLQIITILRKTGDEALARKIRDEALKTLDAPAIRAALSS